MFAVVWRLWISPRAKEYDKCVDVISLLIPLIKMAGVTMEVEYWYGFFFL
jgi:hypothetical protein